MSGRRFLMDRALLHHPAILQPENGVDGEWSIYSSSSHKGTAFLDAL
jgi:hypothetical protein